MVRDVRSLVLSLPENSNQVAGGCRHRGAMRPSFRLFRWAHSKNDRVPLRAHVVRMNSIEIEDHSCHQRSSAVLCRPYASHSVRADRKIPGAVASGIRKVEENPIRIDCRFNRGLDYRAESNLDAQIGALARSCHILHDRRPGAVLRRCARQQ